VSYETIFRTLYIQAGGGALKKESIAYARQIRAMRRLRHYTQKTTGYGSAFNARFPFPVPQRRDRASCPSTPYLVVATIRSTALLRMATASSASST